MKQFLLGEKDLKRILYDTVFFAYDEADDPPPEERHVVKAVNKTMKILKNGKAARSDKSKGV